KFKTVEIECIFSGIAYSALSGVAPVYGLYSSFFPVLFYMFFATSRHNSIGSFAVVSLMTGEANRVIMTKYAAFSTNSTISSTQIAHLRPIMVASTLTFVVGIVQFAAGFLRLEFITAYFSDQLVDGFITGAACIVIAAQVNDVLGVNVPDVTGPAYTFKRFYDVLSQIAQSNVCTVIISVISFAFLYVGRDFISPYVTKRFKIKIPIPYELILVIITTGISYGFRLDQRYGMEIVGDIPAGMPLPQVPVFSILLDCLPHALSITAVIIAVHISMAKMLAKKMNYEIDSRQELYALGLSSMLGGLFPIYPVSTAMGRTMVNVESGSRTQLAALFSCLLLLIVILWLGPLLESLPICVLAVIIIMALRSLFEKVDYLKNLWHGSKIDLLTWLVAFVTTVGLDVMKGLVISIIFALLTIVFRSQWPKSETLAPTRGAEDFENLRRYKALSQYPDIHIFRFDSPLLFPNVENFKAKILKQIKSWSDGDSDTNDSVTDRPDTKETSSMKFIIIDCSCISFIDCMGVNALKEAVHDTKSRRVTLLLAAATGTF
ncbi:unnamed protein product, partial [Anisakis simplex]|uniref:STAS domain-containing protein n=1 Tax=Anisakis simplex TaxID=6269 RepID=A0A0M3IZ93_ANISI